MAPRASSLAGVAIVVTAAAMFGTLGPVTRFSFELGLAPFAYIAWRSLIGMLGAGGLVALRGARTPAGPVTISRGDRLRGAMLPGGRAGIALVAAGAGGFIVNVGMFMAFQRIPVAIVLLTFYTYPALVALVAVALGREAMDRSRAVALVLASLGALLVVAAQPRDGTVPIDLLGIGLALLAALGQTLFVTVSRDGFPHVRADMAVTFVLAFIAAAGAVGAIVAGTGASLGDPLASPTLLGLLIFAGLFTAAIPSILLMSGIRLLGGVRAGILMLIEPMVGVILAALLLAEPVQPIQLLGGVAILAAAVILTRATIDAGTSASATIIAPAAGPAPASILQDPGGG